MRFDKKNINKFFQNKIVLYIILGISLINLIGFLATNNLSAIIIFLLLGFISSIYTKNMSYILLIPLVLTNILLLCNGIKNSMKESFAIPGLDDDSGDDGGDEKKVKDSNKRGKKEAEDENQADDPDSVKKSFTKSYKGTGKCLEHSKKKDCGEDDECMWKEDKCHHKAKSGFNNMDLTPANLQEDDDADIELVQKDKSLTSLNKIIGENAGIQKILQDPDKLMKYMDSMGPLMDKMGPLMNTAENMLGSLKKLQ